MFITRKHISRRAVLRGMGVTMALPLIEAMVPARTAFAKTAATVQVHATGPFVINYVNPADDPSRPKN